MSTNIFVYVTTKEGQPLARYYLGGNKTKDALWDLFAKADEQKYLAGFSSVDVTDNIQKLLNFYEDSFYSGNSVDILEEDFLNKKDWNNFKYWLVFDY